MTIPDWPKNMLNFQYWNAVLLTEERRDRLAREVLNIMLAEPQKMFTYIGTGDTLMVARRHQAGGTITIEDCQIRRVMHFAP